MKSHGFTLIELLIVLSILAILMGMAMPIISLAQKRSAISDVQSMAGKVQGALFAFKLDIGAFPFQGHAVSADFPAADNTLGRRLAYRMSATERAAQLGFADTYAARYNTTPHQWTEPNVTALGLWDNWGALPYTFNQHSKVRARAAFLSGNLGVKGVGGNSATALISAPPVTAFGWGDDYLAGEVQAQRIRRDADGKPDCLLDRWGTPFVYNCLVVPGVRYTQGNHGRITTELKSGIALGPVGRALITTLDSDQRSTASALYRFEYELWSSGPDRTISPTRNNGQNRDNIADREYLRGLH